jgi:hypothetical protein
VLIAKMSRSERVKRDAQRRAERFVIRFERGNPIPQHQVVVERGIENAI